MRAGPLYWRHQVDSIVASVGELPVRLQLASRRRATFGCALSHSHALTFEPVSFKYACSIYRFELRGSDSRERLDKRQIGEQRTARGDTVGHQQKGATKAASRNRKHRRAEQRSSQQAEGGSCRRERKGGAESREWDSRRGMVPQRSAAMPPLGRPVRLVRCAATVAIV